MQELTPEEIAAEEVAELPNREAMSLICTDPSTSMLGGVEPLPSDGTLPVDGATDSASVDPAVLPTAAGTSDPTGGMVDDAGDLGTGAAGSESGSETLTDSDRSDQFTNSDSAYAGPQ